MVWELVFRGRDGEEASLVFLLWDAPTVHSSVVHWLSFADQKVWLAVSFASTNIRKEDKVIVI